MVSQNAKMDEFCRNSHTESSILCKAGGQAKNEDSFPISAILDSLRLVDVTEDKVKRDAAFKLTIEMYSKLSSRGIDYEQMYRSLCQDKYLREGLARIFVLEGLNPVSMKVDILGTIRVVLGSESDEEAGRICRRAHGGVLHPGYSGR